MFEVEKKFILTKEQQEHLITDAQFLGEKKFTDIYYDSGDFALTKKDTWLRSRDGKCQLKLPLNESIENRVSDQYQELEAEKEVVHYFEPGSKQSLDSILIHKGYKPFCEITTWRKKYQKDGFGIDLDVMDFDYMVAEIEYMTDDQDKIPAATQAIIEFAKKHNIISDGIIYGKVVEYLRRNNPNHFQALVDARVVR